jgi:hypothetical protein
MQLFVPDPAQPRGFATRTIDQILAIEPSGTVVAAGGVGEDETSPPIAWLVPWHGESLRRGVLALARPGEVWINGRSALPLTALRRGDEIRIGGVSLFFTDEAPLGVTAYEPPGGDRPAALECTRCHGPIRPGDPIVSCPACGAVYMAQADRTPNCWEFGPCLSCGRDPGLEFAWEPRAALPPQPWHHRPWRRSTATARPPVSPDSPAATELADE